MRWKNGLNTTKVSNSKEYNIWYNQKDILGQEKQLSLKNYNIELEVSKLPNHRYFPKYWSERPQPIEGESLSSFIIRTSLMNLTTFSSVINKLLEVSNYAFLNSLLIIKQIKEKFLGDLTESVKTQKIFEMIKKGKIDKHSLHGMQNIILKDIRDELKAGKSFEVVMEELETKEKEYLVEEGLQTYSIRVPPNYTRWHERACSEARKKSSDLILSIYLAWLKNKAKKNDWRK